MATPIDCNACDSLRENAAEFVANGVNNNVCNSLKNNTGYGKKRNNCTDVDDANDCLVGRMAQEADAYEVCDWKEYIKKFVGNVHSVIKSIICWLCGVQAKVDKHDCQIDALMNGTSFSLYEEGFSDTAYVVPGKGVSWDDRDPSTGASNISMTYVAGGLVVGGGSLTFHATDWSTDVKDIEGNKGKGNTNWRVHDDNIVNGGELIYEIRIKKSAYGIDRFFNGFGQESNYYGMRVAIQRYPEGVFARGQHGACSTSTGEPTDPSYSHGHPVPQGWEYIQVRSTWVDQLIRESADTAPVTPRYFCGVRFNSESLC